MNVRRVYPQLDRWRCRWIDNSRTFAGSSWGKTDQMRRWWWYTWTRLHLMRIPLRWSALKSRGSWRIITMRTQATGEKHNLWRRRNDIIPAGYSGWVALRREQCDIHQLLGSDHKASKGTTFIVRQQLHKYATELEPLLGNVCMQQWNRPLPRDRYKYGDLSLRRGRKVWVWILRGSDWGVTALKITDPSSHRRGHPIISNKCLKRIFMEEKEKLTVGPRSWPYTRTDWQTDRQS
jgi:hypothetical protein